MSTPERRHIPRTTVERLAYIHIEPNNGGIVLNVSHEGLCFHSIAPVQKNGPVRFSLLEQNRRIAACGELAWTDEIQKIGGLRFTTLTAEAREQIQDWISHPAASPEGHHASTLGSALLKAFPSFRSYRSVVSADSRNSSALAATLLRIRVRIKLSGFARGLATGLLISMLCACVFLLYAQRRDIGKSLIHLGEQLAGERLDGEKLAAERSAGQRLAAKPEAETQHVLPAPQMVPPAKETASQFRPQILARTQSPASAPAPVNGVIPLHQQIAPPSQKPVRTQTRAQPNQIPAQPLASPAKPQPITLKPSAPASVGSHAANNSTAQPSAVQGNSETAALLPPAAVPGVSSSPASKIIANGLVASPSPEPVGPVQVASSTQTDAVSLPLMYFEIGKFKDELRARDLGDRVAHIGLHPSVVQKGHLWMNAFYVLVGPYETESEATRTQVVLVSHGYKPRPFERGSRNFAFISRVTLEGAKLPIGAFTITWESYVTDAKVKVAQGNYALATADGQWVKRPRRYQRDEYVYVTSSNGSRLLREIHFSGLDRALVFRNPS